MRFFIAGMLVFKIWVIGLPFSLMRGVDMLYRSNNLDVTEFVG